MRSFDSKKRISSPVPNFFFTLLVCNFGENRKGIRFRVFGQQQVGYLVGNLQFRQGVGDAEGGIDLDGEVVDFLFKSGHRIDDLDRVDELGRLSGDEVSAYFLDLFGCTLHIDVSVERLDVLISTGFESGTIGNIGSRTGTHIVGRHLGKHIIHEGDGMVLEVDRLGDGIFLTGDHHRGRGVRQCDGALDSVTASDQVMSGLVIGFDLGAEIAERHTVHLSIVVLIGEHVGGRADRLFDTGIDRFEFAERLMDTHLFGGHVDSPFDI